MRAAARERGLALSALVVLGVGGVAGPAAPAIFHEALAVVALAIAALARWAAPGAVASLAAVVAGLMAAGLFGLPWQATMALALAAWGLLRRNDRGFATGPSALARGRVPWLATAAIGGVTPIALALWYGLSRPDLGDILRDYVPDLPFALLVVGGVGFALVNAALEEIVWRGVFDAGLGGGRVALVVSALSFGVAHTHGFPRGALGVALAGTWALMLGWLRREADGLLAPFLAHVIADASIAVIILGIARGLP